MAGFVKVRDKCGSIPPIVSLPSLVSLWWWTQWTIVISLMRRKSMFVLFRCC